MFSSGQYRSTEKGYELIVEVFENIIFSDLNLTEFFMHFLSISFQLIKKWKMKKWF